MEIINMQLIVKINKYVATAFIFNIFSDEKHDFKKYYDMFTSTVVYINSLCYFENLRGFIIFDDG